MIDRVDSKRWLLVGLCAAAAMGLSTADFALAQSAADDESREPAKKQTVEPTRSSDDARPNRAANVRERGNSGTKSANRAKGPPNIRRDRPGHPSIEPGGRRYPRQFDLRPQFYRDNGGYRFGVPAFDEFRDDAYEQAYRQGLADAREEQHRRVQAGRGLAAYQDAMFAGHEAFAKGRYGLAARQFLLAATLNQGDPASRLCAAHAQTALGDYVPAARLIRRALEIEPRLIYLPMDLRGAYGDPSDLAKHRAALRKAATQAETDSELWFLLGYYHFFTNNMGKADDAFARAVELEPQDRLYGELAALARMSSGRGSPLRNAQKNGPHP